MTGVGAFLAGLALLVGVFDETPSKDQRAWRFTVSGCVLAGLTAIGSM